MEEKEVRRCVMLSHVCFGFTPVGENVQEPQIKP